MKSFSVEKARLVQRSIAEKAICEDAFDRPIKFVGGLDVSYAKNLAIGAAVVVDYETLEPVEEKVAVVEARFPYIPTLLSFREVAPLIAAIKKLSTRPQVFLVDAQGRAHPYFCGLATHLGVVLDIPTIGVAKSKLCGELGPFEDRKAPLYYKGELVGYALLLGRSKKPVFVSIGHRVSLETAVDIVMNCSKGRIPVPIKLAHSLASKERKKIIK